jgi:hypothetical protein
VYRFSSVVRISRWQVWALVAVLSITGRASGQVVTGVAVTTPRPCDANGCGALRPDPVWFAVTGRGLCLVRVDFGDGTSIQPPAPIDFDRGPWPVYHFFANSWPGPKTIRAEGIPPCSGMATVSHRVFEGVVFAEKWVVALAAPTQMCYPVPGGLPPLRTNTRVTVSALTTPKVDFRCPAKGCVYDPDGKPSSSASTRFPFPGLREFSLILMVGNQVQQGGTNASAFVTNQPGGLSICLNDDNTRDNIGGWEIHLSVDESQAR